MDAFKAELTLKNPKVDFTKIAKITDTIVKEGMFQGANWLFVAQIVSEQLLKTEKNTRT